MKALLEGKYWKLVQCMKKCIKSMTTEYTWVMVTTDLLISN